MHNEYKHRAASLGIAISGLKEATESRKDHRGEGTDEERCGICFGVGWPGQSSQLIVCLLACGTRGPAGAALNLVPRSAVETLRWTIAWRRAHLPPFPEPSRQAPVAITINQVGSKRRKSPGGVPPLDPAHSAWSPSLVGDGMKILFLVRQDSFSCWPLRSPRVPGSPVALELLIRAAETHYSAMAFWSVGSKPPFITKSRQ